MTDTTTARPTRPAHFDDDPPVRGIGHLRHPVVSGGLIGVVGGGAFLFGGIAGLPAEHQGTLRGSAAAPADAAHRADARPRRVYGIAVVTMLALLPVTRLVALALDAPTAQIALVAAVVGGHFLPFARAFQAPVFWWIGGAMAVLGLAGAVLAALGDPVAGPAGAAAAGAAMLVIVAAQGLLASPRQD